MNFVLIAFDLAGNKFYFTGCAGSGWVSPNRAEAFLVSREGGLKRAERFNAMEQVHGLQFFLEVLEEVA